MPVSVTSEVGALRTVLTHTPGPELTVVTPDNRDDFLFNDILDLEAAREEHLRFRTLLERFAEVREIRDVLAEVLEIPEARSFLLARAEEQIRDRAAGLDAGELVRLFVEGEESSGGGSLARALNETGYALPPLPNLFFPRDPAAVVGDRVMVASMQHDVRWTEELIARAVFQYHPDLAGAGFVYDGTEERRFNTSVEGGDVHVLRHDLLLVGLSERTTAAGVDAIREGISRGTGVRDVLVVVLPPHRTSIHLDMVFTMVDRDLCCCYAPYFVGPRRLPVLHLSRSFDGIRELPNLFTGLSRLDLPVEPVFCAGGQPVAQEREQWASGCNLLAVRPGQVLAYERNEATLEALAREGGFRVLEAERLLEDGASVDEGERVVVTFPGSELVRGGGGPRCMTLPVRRDDPWRG